MSYRSFDEFSQKSRKFIIFILSGKETFFTTFSPKIPFWMVWVPQTITLPFKLGDTGSNFGGSFDGGWKTFQGSSIPEKNGKDPTRNGGEISGPILGFQITDNYYA